MRRFVRMASGRSRIFGSKPDGGGGQGGYAVGVHRQKIVIVTPALADANNGNWQTARRWRQMLAPAYRVQLAADWQAGQPGGDADLMVALHARRSAPAVAAWRVAHPQRPLLLVLTGTDLYRDIRVDADAQRSLVLAQCLVVLQSQGLDELPPELRARTRVIEQSARPLPPLAPRRRSFDLLLVGHLRPEKDPLTAVRALARLDDAAAQCLRLIQVGDTLDAGLAERMRDAARADARIELRGALPHARTRALIRHGRVLLLPSRIEGGANVLIEAVTACVPVLASRIPGSVGMLGQRYDGFFEAGDDLELARLIRRCQVDPAFDDHLRAQCAARAPLFDPRRERAARSRRSPGMTASTPTLARSSSTSTRTLFRSRRIATSRARSSA